MTVESQILYFVYFLFENLLNSYDFFLNVPLYEC